MSNEDSILDNIEVHKNFAIISVNPKLYPLSVIYSAAYWLLDKVHVIIDGDPETEILIEIRPKDKDVAVDLKEVGYFFNDELINYAVYTVQATRNKKLREMVMENALAGNLRNVSEQNIKPEPFIQQSQQQTNFQAQVTNPDRQFVPTSVQKDVGRISSLWKPGEQPINEEMDKQLKKSIAPSQTDSLFKGADNIDDDGITSIKNYRHKSSAFQGVREDL